MTNFEQYLIDIGYTRLEFDCKNGFYKKSQGYHLSSMGNLDYRYFHNTNSNIDFLLNPKFKDASPERKTNLVNGEIIFGLNEYPLPPTLVSPRPNIIVKRIKDGRVVELTGELDADMTAILQHFDPPIILLAMYNKSITLTLDLTK